MPRAPALGLLTAFAGCLYQPGSFAERGTPFAGARVPLGDCLDVTVALADDVEATGSVLEYSFGNRCWHAVTVDLASVRAVATGPDGGRTELVAYDPRHELVALPLEARWQGHERIEYHLPGAAGPAPRICVDVGGVDGSAPHRERWVCPGAADPLAGGAP